MKDKHKILIIALFLFLIFSLGAVAATENMAFNQSNGDGVSAETPMMNQDIQDIGSTFSNDEVGSENMLNANDNSLLNANHTVSGNTFEDIQTVVNNSNDGDIIYLNGSTYSGSGNSIVIDKEITLVGGSSMDDGKYATLDAQGLSRIITVKTTSNVIIYGIKFINGYYVSNSHYDNPYHNFCSGALNGGVAVNCTFIGNSADSGGAMLGGRAVNCTFIGNSANNGGAMLGGRAENCTFINNSVSSNGGRDVQGGAMYGGVAVNCTFVGNSVQYEGLYDWCGHGGAMFEGVAMNCTFIGNSANNGGAMSHGDAVNCTFINNSAKKYNGGAMYGGSAFNCTFIGNSAKQSGGAMTGFSDYSAVNCTFIGNSANNGGAMDDGDAFNCTFIGNSAGKHGGAMCDGGAVNCTFINNSAKTYHGGAMYVGSAFNCTFIGNSAKQSGGAIDGVENDGVPHYYAVNCTFINNSAMYGGAICMVDATNCTFINNTGKSTVIAVFNEFSRWAVDYKAGERGDYFYGTLYDIWGNGSPLANKMVQITINGKIYNVKTDSQGRAGIKVNLASANTYTYALYFAGDEEYTASLLASSKLTVVKKTTAIIANSNYAFKASAKTKTVTVALNTIKNQFNGKFYLGTKTLTLTVNGKTYTGKTDAKGVVKFNIQITRKGTYSATIKFAGDATYLPISRTVKITIADSAKANAPLKGTGVGMTPKKLNTDSKENTWLYGTWDYFRYQKIPTGSADSIKKGTYIEVNKVFSRVACDYNAGERGDYFYATLRDSDGNALASKMVQIAINGQIYKIVTDSQGRAGLQVNLASANTYTYALAFSGDEDYQPATLAYSKLTVTKKPINIAVTGLSFKATAKTKTVTVTLKTSKNPYDSKTYLNSGKKVTLTVGGKTFTGTIDSKGVVKFNIGSLTKKGTYDAVIKFAGDSTYNAGSKTVKIKLT